MVAQTRNYIQNSINDHYIFIKAFDENNLYLVSERKFAKTTNGGLSWYTSNIFTNANWLASATFADVNTGWGVGVNGIIMKTTNGGNNWFSQVSGTTNLLYCTNFLNTHTGWVCGGSSVIIKTTNGGNNWVTYANGQTSDVLSVLFFDDNTGYSVSGLWTDFQNYKQRVNLATANKSIQ